jgi:hypothetical protein
MPGGGGKRPVPGPAFNDAALDAAAKAARAIWRAESAAERDRLLRLAPVERLAAMDDQEVRDALTPQDRALVLDTLAAALPRTPVPDPTEEEMRAEHEREMAEWRANLAASDAARARQERRGRLLVAIPWAAAAVLLLVWLLR